MCNLYVVFYRQAKKSSKHKKLSKSRSSKEWDLNVPFKCLEEVTLSGDLHYKGKLSWSRKTCALSEGRLLCYKPDKCDSKSALVIQLTGYNSTYVEKDNRKGFEIKLTHPTLEVHILSVDFKEWAVMWCDVSIFCSRLLFKFFCEMNRRCLLLLCQKSYNFNYNFSWKAKIYNLFYYILLFFHLHDLL